MENASKALMISAVILITVILLVIATRIFNSAASVTKTYDEVMEFNDITAFNTNFTKYIGAVETDGKINQTYATIYDVISVANFAFNYNSKIAIDKDELRNGSKGLVRVDLKDMEGDTITNLQNYTNKVYSTLLQECHYQNIDLPNANSIVTYEIDIVAVNPSGKICHVAFTPTVRGHTTTTIRYILNNYSTNKRV